MITLLLSFPVPSLAAGYLYAPENCEFSMVLPEEPLSAMRCNPDKPAECYKTITFNRILAIDSGIHVTATCTPAEKNMLQRYSGEVMEYTLESMAKGTIKDYQTGFADHGDAKQATLLGAREMPDGTSKIYMAQLWIGKTSVFTVEAELTGPEATEGDAIFTSVLKSIGLKKWAEENAEKDKKSAAAQQKDPAKDGEISEKDDNGDIGPAKNE